jgi:hypothetical protein
MQGLLRGCAGLCLVGMSGCVEPPTVVVQPLRVINWSPASGSICIDPNATVHVTFSDDLVTTTVTSSAVQLLDAGDTAVAGELDYDSQTFTVSFVPAAALAYGSEYSVAVSESVEGTLQGALLVELRSTFTTIASGGCVP